MLPAIHGRRKHQATGPYLPDRMFWTRIDLFNARAMGTATRSTEPPPIAPSMVKSVVARFIRL